MPTKNPVDQVYWQQKNSRYTERPKKRNKAFNPKIGNLGKAFIFRFQKKTTLMSNPLYKN